MFLNNRHYDPTTGVFVSVDPLVTLTMEPYIYGSANPVMISDPSGLCGCEFFGDPSTKESHDFYGVKYPGDPGGNTYSSASDQKSISAAIRGAWSSPGATTPHEPATSGFGYEAGQKAEAAFKFLVFDSDACGGESLDGWCAVELATLVSPCKGPLRAICRIPGVNRGASRLTDDVIRRADSNLTGSGETVLGHYADDYIGVARQRGASYFDIGDAWEGLSDAQRLAANNRVLDAAIANGDRIVLATARSNIRYPSALADEIGYLTSRGYSWVDDMTLVAG